MVPAAWCGRSPQPRSGVSNCLRRRACARPGSRPCYALAVPSFGHRTVLSLVRSVAAYVQVARDRPAIQREFRRLHIALDEEAEEAALDAATPPSADTRAAASWMATARASAAFLALLRQVPSGAGLEGTVAHFQRARDAESARVSNREDG